MHPICSTWQDSAVGWAHPGLGFEGRATAQGPATIGVLGQSSVQLPLDRVRITEGSAGSHLRREAQRHTVVREHLQDLSDRAADNGAAGYV